MKLVAANPVDGEPQNDVETVVLSRAQFDYLGRVGRDMNRHMPMAFAGAHIVRTLLERLEESGIDLSAAGTEEELTHVAARGLRQRVRQQRRTRG